MTDTVLITRPRAAAIRTVQALALKGWDSHIEPMLEIVNRDVSIPDISSHDAIIFTSANGVEAFAALPGKDFADKAVYAVGAATAAAARAAGFKDVMNGGGTAEHLNALLAGEGLKKIIHFSGEHIAGEITLPDGTVERVILYAAQPARALSEACRAGLAQGRFGSILFFSVRTAQIFADLVRQAGLEQQLSPVQALCISGAVVKCLQDLPWNDIKLALGPDQDSMIDLLGNRN